MKRECGDCTICCTFARVPEFNKPERVTCTKCASSCTIYNTRPKSCATFECAWLQGKMSDDDRPDKIGIMVEDYDKFIFAMCDGDEWKTSKSLNSFIAIGKPIVISSKTGNGMLLPENMHPSEVIKLVQEKL